MSDPGTTDSGSSENVAQKKYINVTTNTNVKLLKIKNKEGVLSKATRREEAGSTLLLSLTHKYIYIRNLSNKKDGRIKYLKCSSPKHTRLEFFPS